MRNLDCLKCFLWAGQQGCTAVDLLADMSLCYDGSGVERMKPVLLDLTSKLTTCHQRLEADVARRRNSVGRLLSGIFGTP